jgi:uncharacterized protein (DUF433 family)
MLEFNLSVTFESVRDAMMLLPKGDKARLLSVLTKEVTGFHAGIDFQEGVCGGSTRVIRTRIPVWLLESLCRSGSTDAQILSAYPSLTAEDLANAWHLLGRIGRRWIAKLPRTATISDRRFGDR